MYVDESGVEGVDERTELFIVTGVIFHKNDLDTMETEIQNYKDTYFTGKFQDAEIHLRDIFKGKRKFRGLGSSERAELLNSLYSAISNLTFTIISAAIVKQKFVEKHPAREILDYAYMFLMERFDKFLVDNDDKGLVHIDRITPTNKTTIGKSDSRILELINKIRKSGTYWHPPATSIAEEPVFIPSHLSNGLQVADAVAYCISRKINYDWGFDDFWDQIYPKFRADSTGKVDGYGLRIYPE